MERIVPREGDVHAVVCVGGHSFTIRYGYYTELERHSTDPIPIYPCFVTNPHYTQEGCPLVTRVQDACEHYDTGQESGGDRWCADCIYCSDVSKEIGICRCDHRRLLQPNTEIM